MKKGFTLIELLAVIVILAIIALIATPIVLNIINDTKKSATLRSADFYLDAVELSISQATLKNKKISDDTYEIKNGDICLSVDCNDKLEVEVNGEVPKKGTIAIKNGKITGLNIILDNKEIYKTSKNEMVYVKLLDEVCKIKSGTPKTAGAKYECKVDPNKDPYTFYVLTTPSGDDTRINLIMDKNINSDGSPVTKAITEPNKDYNGGIYNLVAWVNERHYGTLYPYDELRCWNESGCVVNDKGPLTAMNFLQEATKNWTNVNEMIVDTYTDQKSQEREMKVYNTYARMPYYSEVGGSNGTNEYLYENLEGEGWEGTVGKQPTNNISSIYGYWTISSCASSSGCAWVVYYLGNLDYRHVVYSDGHYGVRPVITLKL